MSAVEEVKRRIDLVDFLSGHLTLKKAGRTYKGLCPFHTEKTPSFVVYPDEGRWYCFGACGTGGDLFTFLMRRENLTFPEALRRLAQRAGVELEAPSAEAQEETRRRRKLEEMHLAAAGHFHRLLLEADAARGARQYLEERGITPEMIRHFQLGYALDSWDDLRRTLAERGYGALEMTAGGLLIEGQHGPYDRFRGRLLFPIREAGGAVVGFGARALQPEQQPKYLNSPQTALFNKSAVLYGLEHAQEAIRDAGQAVLVEGYTDVIAAHQFGHRNVVASLGTSLTETQMRLLKRLTGEVVLALDADTAGLEATLRGLEVAQAVAGEEKPVALGPRLIRHERRLEMTLRVVTLPQELDPDEAIRRDPQGWPRLLEAARPLADFLFDRLIQDLDLADARDKVRAAERLLPLIREMPSEVERRHYLGRLVRLTDSDERALLADMQRLARRGRSQAGARPSSEALPRPGLSMESYLLTLLLRQPERVQELPLKEEDFDRPEHRAIAAHLKDGDLESAEPALRETLQDLLERTSALPELEEEDLLAELHRTLWHVKENRCRREIAQVQSLFTQVESPDEEQLLRQRVVQLQNDLRTYQHSRETFTLTHRGRLQRSATHGTAG